MEKTMKKKTHAKYKISSWKQTKLLKCWFKPSNVPK